jgi:peptidoglycan LD-endopeptidase LytH
VRINIQLALWLVASLAVARAETFVLPTPNRALLTPGAEENYFVPTPGRTWESGTFGCVRSDGMQLHEGLDIKCLKRGAQGEPADPIFAAADGRVVYINQSSSLSNYGKYLILEHEIEGLPVFTTYAHLSRFAEELSVGDRVQQGQVIATMGRTSNTRQGISKDRAHLHFEVCLRLNERFAAWHQAKLTGQRNDHGNWNGRNFIGLDPRLIFLEQKKAGEKFSLLAFIRSRPELCRVVVRDTSFPWLNAYPRLIRRNPVAEKNGVAGYELALDYNGLPFLLIPRSSSEIRAGPKLQVLSVNQKEQAAHPCRKLVRKNNQSWQLAPAGTQLLDLLTY